jgi:hypothetical protein
MEHFGQFFVAISTGLGLFLAGAVNLLLIRRRFALRAVATTLAIGLTLAASAAIDQPDTLVKTARYLVIGLIPVLFLGSTRLVSGVVAVLRACSQPVVRYTLLTVAGIGVSVGSIILFEHTEEQVTSRGMDELELLESRVPIVPVEREKAITDRGTLIQLREPVEVRENEVLSDVEDRYFQNIRLKNQVIRHSAPDDRSNCHGWIFTGGRFILSGDDVDLILKENEYTKQDSPQQGDLVIYRSGGMITHTAVVQLVAEDQAVLVRSKWGSLGVFVHPIDKSPYGTDYTFHRSTRAGHLLTTAPSAGATSTPPMATE